MPSKAAQISEILSEVDRTSGLFQNARDRAQTYNDFFYPRSVQDYLLFMWLEADHEERFAQALEIVEDPHSPQQRWVDGSKLPAALKRYTIASGYRKAITGLLPLVSLPSLPGWVDTMVVMRPPEPDQEFLDIQDAQDFRQIADEEERLALDASWQVNWGPESSRHTHLDQSLLHYKRTAIARRHLIGGWFHEFSANIPRILLDEEDIKELRTYKQRLQQIETQVARLDRKTHDPYIDEVAKFFPLGVGGSGHNTPKLNRRKERSLERTIEASRKLVPLYREHDSILSQINHIMSGARKRERQEETGRSLLVKQGHLRVLQAKPGDIAIDIEMGRVQVVKQNKESLTVLSPTGRKIVRRLRFFLDAEPQ